MKALDKTDDALEMSIARTEGNYDLIWKHPSDRVPMRAQCTVSADDWLVFARDGRPVGTLASGRTVLSSDGVPFLKSFESDASPGVFDRIELYFVRKDGYEVKLTEAPAEFMDLSMNTRIPCSVTGAAQFTLVNPEKLIDQRFGAAHKTDAPDTRAWLAQLLLRDLDRAITLVAADGSRSLREVALDTEPLRSPTGGVCDDAGLSATLRNTELTVFDDAPLAAFTEALNAAAVEAARIIGQQTEAYMAQAESIEREQAQREAEAAQKAPPEPAPVAVSVKCEACQESVRPGKFCAQCGAALRKPPPVCQNCRAELIVGKKFCPDCGTAQTA